MIENIIPYSAEIEKAVLGAALLGSVKGLGNSLKPEFFHLPQNQELAESILNVDDSRSGIDVVSVCEDLVKRGKLDDVPMYYVAGVSADTPTATNYPNHLLILKEYYLRRKVLRSCRRMLGLANDKTIDILDTVGAWETEISNLTDNIVVKESHNMRKLVDTEVKSLLKLNERFNAGESETFIGLETKLQAYDNKIGGFLQGYHLIAGRPGQGKTALALYFMTTFAEQNIPVGFFSIEMSAQALTQRILISQSGIDSYKLKTGQVDDGTITSVLKIAGATGDLNIIIDDTSGITFPELKSKARTMRNKHKVGAIFVDYVGLIKQVAYGSVYDHFSKVSKGLLELSGELGIPIFVLSQVNRECLTRPDKVPHAGELRQSGSFEEDADSVTFIVRPDFYKIESYEDGTLTKGTALLRVDKNRNGETGDVVVNCDITKYKFNNLLTGFDDFNDENLF